MEIMLIILGILTVLFVVALYVESKQAITWIPMIMTEGPSALNLREIPYCIDTSNLKFKYGGEVEVPLTRFKLFIIGGNAFKDITLQDGRHVLLEDGDCIVVDPEINIADGHKTYIINPYPEHSNQKDVRIETSDNITAESNILGAIIGKISAEVMEEKRRGQY